jgi:hypothetical protein
VDEGSHQDFSSRLPLGMLVRCGYGFDNDASMSSRRPFEDRLEIISVACIGKNPGLGTESIEAITSP